jgi:hypothetical protein
MVAIDISLKAAIAVEAIEQYTYDRGLIITMRGSLKQHPGCFHWHLKKHKEKGTFEITLFKEGKKLQLSYHENRAGDWIPEEMKVWERYFGLYQQ